MVLLLPDNQYLKISYHVVLLLPVGWWPGSHHLLAMKAAAPNLFFKYTMGRQSVIAAMLLLGPRLQLIT